MSQPAARTAILEQLASVVDLPGVRERADAAREACTRLRFHEALRRRIPEASAESRVRGAHASAGLDGANLPLAAVREHMSGARPWPDDAEPEPARRQGRGRGDRRERAGRGPRADGAAAGPRTTARRRGVGGGRGRPAGPAETGTESCDEFVDLGPSARPSVVSVRLAGLAEMIAAVSAAPNRVPAVVVSSLVHAEIVSIRPFVHGNGLVARAMERALVQALGLDPTGVAVPEAGHVAGGGPAYLGALTAYASGSPAGVGLWLGQAADAMVAAAAEGERVCDAVGPGA